jgi:hypothetical protein
MESRSRSKEVVVTSNSIDIATLLDYAINESMSYCLGQKQWLALFRHFCLCFLLHDHAFVNFASPFKRQS